MTSQANSKELRGFQRRHLRALAHSYKPVVMVGEAGISDKVVEALDQALLDHELVKVRLRQPDDKKSAARELAERTHAQLCGILGHTVILYRPHPESPSIELPKRPAG
jgi:RNA-binding protein